MILLYNTLKETQKSTFMDLLLLLFTLEAGQGTGGKRETADGSVRGANRRAAEVSGGVEGAQAGDGASTEGGAGGHTAGLRG